MSCPCEFAPVGAVERADGRWRGIKDATAPHGNLTTLKPPKPPLHALGATKRERVVSLNEATGVAAGKAEVRAMRMRPAGAQGLSVGPRPAAARSRPCSVV